MTNLQKVEAIKDAIIHFFHHEGTSQEVLDSAKQTFHFNLESILLVLNTKGDYAVDSGGDFYKYKHGKLERLGFEYELGETLDLQSYEFIDWFYDLLTKAKI